MIDDPDIAERNEALRTLDVAWAMRMAPFTCEEAAIIALHKARYECLAIEPALRELSRAWLEERGYGRLGMLPWPPQGQLPE